MLTVTHGDKRDVTFTNKEFECLKMLMKMVNMDDYLREISQDIASMTQIEDVHEGLQEIMLMDQVRRYILLS